MPEKTDLHQFTAAFACSAPSHCLLWRRRHPAFLGTEAPNEIPSTTLMQLASLINHICCSFSGVSSVRMRTDVVYCRSGRSTATQCPVGTIDLHPSRFSPNGSSATSRALFPTCLLPGDIKLLVASLLSGKQYRTTLSLSLCVNFFPVEPVNATANCSLRELSFAGSFELRKSNPWHLLEHSSTSPTIAFHLHL